MDWIGWLEIVGTAVGLVYLWLEYKANVWLWLAGIVMPAIYIFVYYDSGFYADMGIQVYYLTASAYGWLLWITKKRKEGHDTPQHDGSAGIRRAPVRIYLPMALVCAAAFGVILFILLNFTDSTVPYGDSFTTALSIVAMWMLAHKYAEQWIVWVAVDAVSCGLYLYKGLYPTAALYGLYTVIAVFGYIKWLKLAKENEKRAGDSTDAVAG